jgi:hypothetical protein
LDWVSRLDGRLGGRNRFVGREAAFLRQLFALARRQFGPAVVTTDPVRQIVVHRAGMRLLLRDAEFGKQLHQYV